MSIAIDEDHQELAATVADFLVKRDAVRLARNLLDADEEALPSFWHELAELGWLGIHLPEEFGGSGYSLEELVVVVEQLGKAVAPGPFVPTAVASAVISTAAATDEELRGRLLPGLASGSRRGAFALDGDFEFDGGQVSGSAHLVLGGPLAELIVLPAGNDAVVVEVGTGVHLETPPNLDPTRRSSRITVENASGTLLPDGRRTLTDIARLVLSAEDVGIARRCTEAAASYACEREQFGRQIGAFQAVKHHCANMLVATELATSAVWDAARSSGHGGQQFSFAAAVAATIAAPAADLCANLSMQVHGGISVTWDHDAHLYLRRATAIQPLLDPASASAELVDLTRSGVSRTRSIDLPADAEAMRSEIRVDISRIGGLSPDEQRQALVSGGYVVPNWPKPYGRQAGAVEQLVIEEEFTKAGITRPTYGITGWVILTLVQHGSEDQIRRWVRPALDQEVIWCQLFSEPDAGSDAAGIKTSGTRVEGGWRVNGQKVWTSGAHVASMGFATVRTDPSAPKHRGITMMALDMHAPGVEVRPLMMITGRSEFNEVFFRDVFVPDEDVVGDVNGGWRVARATLGNESVSIGSGQGQLTFPGAMLVRALDEAGDRRSVDPVGVGRYIAQQQAGSLLSLRGAYRAVAGSGPGPEGAIAKLALSELGHEASAILTALVGSAGAYTEPAMSERTQMLLLHRAMAIAGGTSEIKRNQIAERILGLPRDPLVG